LEVVYTTNPTLFELPQCSAVFVVVVVVVVVVVSLSLSLFPLPVVADLLLERQ